MWWCGLVITVMSLVHTELVAGTHLSVGVQYSKPRPQHGCPYVTVSVPQSLGYHEPQHMQSNCGGQVHREVLQGSGHALPPLPRVRFPQSKNTPQFITKWRNILQC